MAPDGQIETLSEDALLKLETQLRANIHEETDSGRCCVGGCPATAPSRSLRHNYAGAGRGPNRFPDHSIRDELC